MGLISFLVYYRYLLLVPAAILEGPLLSLFAGFLIRLGHLSFLPTYLIFIFGDLVSDTFYYYIGKVGDETKLISKYSKKYKIIGKNYKALKEFWDKHGRKTLFLTKLSYRFTIPFIISAGLAKVPYKKFLSFALPPTFLKYALYISIGYYFAYSYKLAEKYIVLSGVILAILVVAAVYFYRIIFRYLNREVNVLD